jgi:hypothetical protein
MLNPLSTHTFRSNNEAMRNPEIYHLRSIDDHSAILKNDDSSDYSESDHIDRDEEAVPLEDDHTLLQFNRNSDKQH